MPAVAGIAPSPTTNSSWHERRLERPAFCMSIYVAMLILPALIMAPVRDHRMEQKQRQMQVQLDHKLGLVDCQEVAPVQPVHMSKLFALVEKPSITQQQRLQHHQEEDQVEKKAAFQADASLEFPVSLSWWDIRLKGENHAARKATYGNANIDRLARLLLDTPEGAVVDVGANVGFMTHLALQMNRTVFAIEPIHYNIAKLCEGRRYTLQQFDPNDVGDLHLYQAAAGSVYRKNVSITRPADSVGYFDQTSIASNNLQPHHARVKEFVSMITVDAILEHRHSQQTKRQRQKHPSKDNNNDPPTQNGNPISPIPATTTTPMTKIAVVKIDVQGYEYEVLQGMDVLLSQAASTGYPKYILYESDERMMHQATGHSTQDALTLMESYGYLCHAVGDDTLCTM